MKTTFDRFITNDPEQKALFDKEYNEFLLSEFILEKMEEEKISVRELAKRASVSLTVIQKMRKNETSNKIRLTLYHNSEKIQTWIRKTAKII